MKLKVLAFGILSAGVLLAGTFEDQLKNVTGVDVSAEQTNKAVVVALPQPFGVFTNATVFANRQGRIHQIRCVSEYAPDVQPEAILSELEAAVKELATKFNVGGIRVEKDESCYWRRTIDFADSEWCAYAYVAEAKNHGKPLGYFIADLTFLTKKCCKRCTNKPEKCK